jgi:hypothetical protein
MSSHTVRASLEFSFKGETHQLDATLDLERYVAEAGVEPNFHLLLARESGIDPYSYLYEALESYDILFSEPTGLVAHSCHDGCLDWPQFEQDRREEQDSEVVRAIAAQTMGEAKLDENPNLKAALLAAYRAGKARGSRQEAVARSSP